MKTETNINNIPQSASEVKDMRELHFNEPPEMMYKYTSSDRALDVLTNKHIYFAKCSEFNDPYDWRVTPDIETSEKRKIFIENFAKKAHKYGMNITPEKKEEFINDSSKTNKFAHDIVKKCYKADTTGFCCLTDTRHSLPMWAHYADNHKGCCLVLDFSKHSNQKSPEDDFPFHWIKRIEYQKDLPKYDMSSMWTGYFYKSCQWKYENEWRAIMFDKNMSHKSLSLNSCSNKECNGAGLYPLGNFLCGVILGYRMAKAAKKKIQVAARQCGISVQQASPKLYKYGICLTEINSKQSNRIL